MNHKTLIAMLTLLPGAIAIAAPVALWDPSVEFPRGTIPAIEGVTFDVVHRQTEDFKFLHEPRIAEHEGKLFVTFSNAPHHESEPAQIMRGRHSADGGRTWSDVEGVAGPLPDDERYETASMLSHGGRLWAFVGRYAKGSGSSLGMEVHALDPLTDRFGRVSDGLALPGFVPFVAPQRTSDGNWIIGGHCKGVRQPAVAISNGDDLLSWRLVRIEGLRTMAYAETALMIRDARVIAVTRNRDGFALASLSEDHGRSFTPARPSNLPMTAAKPFAGQLSTGQYYVIFNNPPPSRNRLLLAVGEPGTTQLARVWTLIEGRPEALRARMDAMGERGLVQAWAYPEAVEHEGVLYVVFSHNKRHCWIARVPVSAL